MSIKYTLCPIFLDRKGIPSIPWGTKVIIMDVQRQFKRKGMCQIEPKLMTDGDRVLIGDTKTDKTAWVNAEDLADKNPLDS